MRSAAICSDRRAPEGGFEGNRVDAIAGPGGAFHAAEAEVWIDGKRRRRCRTVFHHAPQRHLRRRLAGGEPRDGDPAVLVEDWTLRVTEANADESQLRFEVTGSRTGMDGAA